MSIKELRLRLPMSEVELKMGYKRAQTFAMEEFYKRAIGDDHEEYKKDLRQSFKYQMVNIYKENEELS